MYRKEKTVLIVAMLGLLVVVTSVRPTEAHFIIASWTFPDEYGQGIYAWRPYENSTGVWLQATSESIYYNESSVINWTVGMFIKIYVYCLFNNTLVGAYDLEDGANFIRHNVTVTNTADEIVFSKQNFTLGGWQIYGDVWMYTHWVILNFLPLSGEYYMATVTYEIYW